MFVTELETPGPKYQTSGKNGKIYQLIEGESGMKINPIYISKSQQIYVFHGSRFKHKEESAVLTVKQCLHLHK